MSADPEAGAVVTFPTLHRFMPCHESHAVGYRCLAPLAACHDGQPMCGRLPEAHDYLLAEAWAWRVADAMPDTAQGRRDSEADAETLRQVARRRAPVCWFVILSDEPEDEARRARACGREALRACPGLRS